MNFFTEWRERRNARVEAERQREEKWFNGLKQGDLVRLKSGGPIMTVKRCIGIQAALATGYPVGVHCSVFEKGVMNEYRFYPDELSLNAAAKLRQEVA